MTSEKVKTTRRGTSPGDYLGSTQETLPLTRRSNRRRLRGLLDINAYISPERNSHNEDRIEDIYSDELKSSPIKQRGTKPLRDVSDRFANTKAGQKNPKKSVTFSEDLISETPSMRGPYCTPQKSILKLTVILDESKSPSNVFWEKLKEKKIPSDFSDLWIPGTVIQVPRGAPEIPSLFQSCLAALREPNFNRRFEVYATLNHMLRTNPKSEIRVALAQSVNSQRRGQAAFKFYELTSLLRKDITNIEATLFSHELSVLGSKNDPFGVRVVAQALKLLSSLFYDDQLGLDVPPEDLKWFYSHAACVLNDSSLSKTLIGAYLNCIKDLINVDRAKELRETDLPEKLLLSLSNLKSFQSPSLLSEKFLCFKNLASSFTLMMSKNFKSWYPMLMIELCSKVSPSYFKCSSIAANILYKSACTLQEYKANFQEFEEFLDSDMTNTYVTRATDPIDGTGAHEAQAPNQENVFNFISSCLEFMIQEGQYKVAMEIWMSVVLLTNFDISWTKLDRWLSIFKCCLDAPELGAKLIAIKSWRAVVHKLASQMLPSAARNTDWRIDSECMEMNFGARIKLLIYPFRNTAFGQEHELTEAVNQLFFRIICSFANPMLHKGVDKPLKFVWDKIINPILSDAYFSNEVSSNLAQIGFSVLSNLIRPQPKSFGFSMQNCLSEGFLRVNDLAVFSSKWIFINFQLVLETVISAINSQGLHIHQKTQLVAKALENVSQFTKKEIKISHVTYAIINDLPRVFNALVSQPQFDEMQLEKTLSIFTETFDPTLFFDRFENRNTSVYYEIMIASSEPNFLPKLLSGILESGPTHKILPLFAEVLNNELIKEKIEPYFEAALKSLTFAEEKDFEKLGQLLGRMNNGIELLTIILAESDFSHIELQLLGVNTWPQGSLEKLLCYIEPMESFSKGILKLLREIVVTNFLHVSKYMIEKRSDNIIRSLVEHVIECSNGLEGFWKFNFIQLWSEYITAVAKEEKYELLDKILTATLNLKEIEVTNYVLCSWEKLPKLRAKLGIDESEVRAHNKLIQSRKESSETRGEDQLSNGNKKSAGSAFESSKSQSSLEDSESEDESGTLSDNESEPTKLSQSETPPLRKTRILRSNLNIENSLESKKRNLVDETYSRSQKSSNSSSSRDKRQKRGGLITPDDSMEDADSTLQAQSTLEVPVAFDKMIDSGSRCGDPDIENSPLGSNRDTSTQTHSHFSTFSKITRTLSSIIPDDIKTLDDLERHHVETQVIELLYRLRRSNNRGEITLNS